MLRIYIILYNLHTSCAEMMKKDAILYNCFSNNLLLNMIEQYRKIKSIAQSINTPDLYEHKK